MRSARDVDQGRHQYYGLVGRAATTLAEVAVEAREKLAPRGTNIKRVTASFSGGSTKKAAPAKKKASPAKKSSKRA